MTRTESETDFRDTGRWPQDTFLLQWPQSSEAGPGRSGCLATSSVQLGPRATCQKPAPEPWATQSEVPEASGAPEVPTHLSAFY